MWEEKTPADWEPERRVLPLMSGQRRLSSGKGCWRDQWLLDSAGAERPELRDGCRSLAAADREFRGGPRSRKRLGGKARDWKSAAPAGQLRAFRIGAVFQKRVRRRSSWAEPMRDRSWARPSAIVGRRGDGKEPVRCRNGPSHGPGYRQHRVPGIWGAVEDSLGDRERVALPRMRHLESGPRGGAWIPSGRLGRDQPGERHSIEGTRLQLTVGDC